MVTEFIRDMDMRKTILGLALIRAVLGSWWQAVRGGVTALTVPVPPPQCSHMTSKDPRVYTDRALTAQGLVSSGQLS